MGLLLNSQKKCDVGRHFWFCFIWVMWWSCVVLPQHVTADFSYLIFYFCNGLNLLIPTKKYLPQLTTTTPPSLSCEEEPKKSATTTATMAMDATGHHGSNFSCGSPFWLSWLHHNGCSPLKQQCWLVWLLQVVGRWLFIRSC